MAHNHHQTIHTLQDTLTTVRLPPFRSRFPLECHPDYHSIQDTCLSWILDLLGLTRPEDINFVTQCQYALCTSLCFPLSKTKRLLPLTKLQCWFFFADDILDKTPEPESAESFMHRFFIVLETRTLPPDNDSRRLRFMQGFLEVWREMCEDMGAEVQARMIQGFKEFALISKLQGNFGKEGHAQQDLEGYIRMRRCTAGCTPMVAAVAYCMGLELDEEMVRHPAMRQLIDAVCDEVAWCNDYVSFRKEYVVGDGHNLPAVVSSSFSCSLQEALIRVWKMIEEKALECDILIGEIEADEGNPTLASFLQGLRYMMAGNLYWLTLSARYNGLNAVPIPWNTPGEVTLDLRGAMYYKLKYEGLMDWPSLPCASYAP